MRSLALGLLLLCSTAPPASAEEPPDPHAQHRDAAARMKRASRTPVELTLPALTLVRDDGKSVSLADELGDGRAAIVSFIFTSCTTICPVTSQVLSQVQDRLGADRDKVRIVSISIDPEQDTPARLAAYARKLHAGPEWRHYTGTTPAIVAAQRAFEVYRGDKMNHTPVTFVRATPGKSWIRVDGFPTPDEIVSELRAQR